MRKKLALVSYLLIITIVTNAQTSYPGGILGCIARWNFSTSGTTSFLADVSNNGNDGLNHFVTATQGWRGAPNGAIKYNGSTSFSEVPNSTLLELGGPFTTICLVRFDSFYSAQCQTTMLLSKGYPGNTSGMYSVGISDNIYDNDCNTYTPNKFMRADYMGAGVINTPQSISIVPGKWYFMAGVYNGYKLATYQVVMDSSSRLTRIDTFWTASVGGGVGSNSQDLLIGKHGNPAYPYWLNGVMDEAALFNRALSSEEIYKIYRYLFDGTPLRINKDANAALSGIKANITAGILHIQATDGAGIGEIMVSNLQGQSIAETNITAGTRDIDLSFLPRGVLILKISRKGEIGVQKLTNL